jgi:hypothetical protein
MKSSFVPIACGTVLALMAGAAGAHWFSVREMVTLARLMPQGPAAPAISPSHLPKPPPVQPLPDDGLAKEAKTLLAEARREQPAPAANANPAPATAASRALAGGNSGGTEERLLRLFEDMLQQNQDLRDQVADTNRSMMELRFQVDSYHGQFRPLKVEEEPVYFDDGSGGVLPPLEAP